MIKSYLRFKNLCFKLDSTDEQAAAIRRELDARREKIAEMERVGFMKIFTEQSLI